MKKLITIFTLSVLISSCKEASVESVFDDIVIEANVQSSESNYKTLLANRETYKGEFFDLLNVKRNENILRIFVEGPCDTEGYTVVWDGNIFESYPIKANLVVNYFSKSQIQCFAIAKRTIEIDLKKTFGKSYQENMIINVANASRKQDISIDGKGTVTKLNN